jgi:hypothetical protein
MHVLLTELVPARKVALSSRHTRYDKAHPASRLSLITMEHDQLIRPAEGQAIFAHLTPTKTAGSSTSYAARPRYTIFTSRIPARC